MKLIERYILRRTSLMFFGTLLPLLGIVWTTQALTNVNLVTDSGQSMLAFVKLATLILPSVIPIILPFAYVIGVAQTLTVMNSDSELTVLNAAGSSRMMIIRPVMYLGIALSVISFCVDNFVEPYSRMAVRQMVATAHADMLSSVIQENAFRKVTDGLYVQVSRRKGGGVLEGLFVADTRDPKVEYVYYAREGAIDEKTSALVMNDGEVHRKLPNGDVSVIKFDSYAFDLADLTERAGEATLRAKDRDLPFLLNPDPQDEQVKRNPGAFKAELHRRFTEWTLPILFGLVALVASVDARSHRQARVHPMVSALLVALAIRWIMFYIGNAAESSRYAIPFMYLIPLAVAGFAVRLLARHKSLELPASWRARALKLRDNFLARRPGRSGAAPTSNGPRP